MRTFFCLLFYSVYSCIDLYLVPHCRAEVKAGCFMCPLLSESVLETIGPQFCGGRDGCPWLGGKGWEMFSSCLRSHGQPGMMMDAGPVWSRLSVRCPVQCELSVWNGILGVAWSLSVQWER